jgi:uncharacterized protein
MRRAGFLVLIWSVIAAGSATAQSRPQLLANETLLEVQAVGTARAVPDVASLTVGIEVDGATSKAALYAAAARTNALVAAARASGVATTDLKSESARVRPRYRQKDGDDTDEVVGYRATTSLGVRITEISRVGTIMSALAEAGATDINGPSFTFADASAQVRAARRLAVQAAGEQASDYAVATQRRVGRILRISERQRSEGAGDDIVVTGARMGLARSPLVIEPGEQATTVIVWIDYTLTE